MAKGGKWSTDQFCRWCAEGSEVRTATTLFAQTQDIYGNRRATVAGEELAHGGAAAAAAAAAAVPMWSVHGGGRIDATQ
jgi:hypothetical protein